MKKLFPFAFIVIIAVVLFGCCHQKEKQVEEIIVIPVDLTDATNDFYDNEPTHQLPHSIITVDGETSQTFSFNLDTMSEHSVIVKETVLLNDSNKFIGAYRYDGVSLYDILNKCPLVKKNAEEFNPIIDAYVEVSNDKGEKVVFSWGEIFYPIHRHEIIIATKVMHIVPSKTKELWPLPEESKIIVASDLLTERNISNPTKIIIKSLDKKFEVNRDLKPLYSTFVALYKNDEEVERYTEMPGGEMATYPNVFYGRGRGIHAVTPFTGLILRSKLIEHFPVTTDAIKTGIFTVVAVDGYRAAFTFSEIMNRNDQSEVILIDRGDNKGGKFKVYAAADFFSDRAIKAVSGIWYNEL